MPLSEDNIMRKRAEDALHNSEGQVRLILDSTAEAIFGCDSEGTCLFSNPSAARMLGYDDPAEFMLEQAVSKGRLLSMVSSRNAHNAHWDLPILDPLSATSSMVAFISHDLRHPLAVILANAEFLACWDTGEMQRNDSYREIRCAIDRMDDLISSLLEFSKGRDTLRPVRGNIIDTVECAIRTASARPGFRRIAIEHRHSGQAMNWFDPYRLERVVANLVLNACEAVSPDAGHIVISTAGNRACLQIAVWDNGPGVPLAIRDSVFQPFVSCGKAEGSGLGLAIAKKIVEDHGGEIHLDERSETGTLFSITIPSAIPEGVSVPGHALRCGLETSVTSPLRW